MRLFSVVGGLFEQLAQLIACKVIAFVAKVALQLRAVIFANHYLISKGGGLLVIPESHVPEFKRLLVSYYEGRDDGSIMTFMREKCWKISCSRSCR